MPPTRTCECGECRKCKHRAYMNDYYRRNAQKIRDIANRSRARRIDKVRQYDRTRPKVRDPLKERARRVIGHLVEDGMERPPCETCGAPNADAHHDDYSKPLEVRWLCRKHHMELHRTVAA